MIKLDWLPGEYIKTITCDTNTQAINDPLAFIFEKGEADILIAILVFLSLNLSWSCDAM